MEFADDFEEEDEMCEKEDCKEGEKGEHQDLSFKGPLNHLFPLMLKQNFYDVFEAGKLMQYVVPMRDYIIMPYKMNMFHFYAFENRMGCVGVALGCKQPYLTDNFGSTPLKYALERNSFQCVDIFLSKAIADETFYSDMGMPEVI